MSLHLVTNTHANATALAVQTHKVVVLSIDGLKLVLPQGDIRTVESIVDMHTNDPPANGAGWINYLGQLWPVYCLSGELSFLSYAPVSRRACVMLALSKGYLGLLCDDAQVLANFIQQSFAMPASMQLSESPIAALVNDDNGLACVSDASHIDHFISITSSTTASQERREH
jgi:chemotaxis signal transduction protein